MTTSSTPRLRIARFRRRDQAAVQALVLEGLTEHWGTLDPTLNRELDDIAASFADGIVLVAWLDEAVVGTATLMPHSPGTFEVVRMSVSSARRRHGIGTQLLAELVEHATASGATRLVLETSTDWEEAVSFYRDFGFRVTHTTEGSFGLDTYFALDLPGDRA